jgi:hypothetical protein
MIVAAIVVYLAIAVAVGGLSWVATRQGSAPVAVALFWAVWLGVWWPYTLVLFLVWRTRRVRRG